jgi:hypothetical protein
MTTSRLSPEDYLNERVQTQLDWMANQARRNKRNYKAQRLLQITLGILVSAGGTYASSWQWMPLALTITGAFISLTTAWETVNDYQNNWVRYRRTKEELERERLLYRTASGPYLSSSAPTDEGDAAFTLFVSRVEALLSEEVDQWSTVSAKPTATGTNN